MQAAAARRAVAAMAAAAASFHSTAAALPHLTLSPSRLLVEIKSGAIQFLPRFGGSTDACNPRIRFAVREKRGDAKSALKNLLLNGTPYQGSSNKQMRQQKVGSRSKVRSGPGKNPHSKGKRGQNWRNFDEDCCSDTDTPYGSFGGKTSFTLYWPGENDEPGSSPNGFQWRDESQSTKSRERIWNESDVDEEDDRSCNNDLKNHIISLGLPALGPLKLDLIKSAFRVSALKWHPDKHQGSSQAEAEEKFRRCVEAYNVLASAFKSSR